MSFEGETGTIASRMLVWALAGLAIGGAVGLLVGVVFGMGSAETAIFIGTGGFIGALVGGALGWFRGIGHSAPREGPYDE